MPNVMAGACQSPETLWMCVAGRAGMKEEVEKPHCSKAKQGMEQRRRVKDK